MQLYILTTAQAFRTDCTVNEKDDYGCGMTAKPKTPMSTDFNSKLSET